MIVYVLTYKQDMLLIIFKALKNSMPHTFNLYLIQEKNLRGKNKLVLPVAKTMHDLWPQIDLLHCC